MWKCPDCNYVMDNEDFMCKNCGRKIPKEVTYLQPKSESSLAAILKALSILFIFAGIIIAVLAENILPVITGISNGLIFYVLGEIIQRLHNIENKLKDK